MDFKQTVMNDADEKYQEMLSGLTATPFTKSTAFDDYSVYKQKRETYINRLVKENEIYNNFLTKIKENKENRLKMKKEAKKYKKSDQRLVLCSFLVLVAFVTLAITFVFVSSNKTVIDWVTNYYEKYNFKNSSNIMNIIPNPKIIMIINGVISVILTIFIFKKLDWFFNFFGASIIFGLSIGLLTGLIICSPYILAFMVCPLMPIIFTIIASVLLIIFSTKLQLKKNRLINLMYIGIIVVITIIVMLVASKVNFKDSIGKIISDFVNAIKSSF